MRDTAIIKIGQAFLFATIVVVAAVLTSCEGFTLHGKYADYTITPIKPVIVEYAK